MSGRKRRQYDSEDPRNWTKERYIDKLQSMGIGYHNSWKVEILRQLYLANVPQISHDTSNHPEVDQHQNSSSASSPAPQDHPVSTPRPELLFPPSSSADAVSDAPTNSNNRQGRRRNLEVIPEVVVDNVNNSGNEGLLRETTTALRAATEALSSITQIMAKQSSSNKEKNHSEFTLETALNANHEPCSSNTLPNARVPATMSGNNPADLPRRPVLYSEDLPKMDHVAPSIKKQILEGKDVNLATLLAPKYDLPQAQTMQSGGLTVELSSKKDVRLDHNLTLDEFNRAFRKYRNVMCKTYPQRKTELEQYETDINDIAYNYGPCFYKYHKMFSAKAAMAIQEHNIVINWSKIDERLLNLVTHNVQSRACNFCGDFDHSSKFCDQAKHGFPSKAEFQKGLTPGPPNLNRSFDKRGRPVTNVEGQEICNNYNYSSCFRRDCRLLHACNRCFSKHHTAKSCNSKQPVGNKTETPPASKPANTQSQVSAKKPNA